MTTESTKETTIIHGDCLEKLKELLDNSVDAIVTDPPYGLAFMGKKWDYDVPSQEIWVECLRVLKHGGHLLAFAGTRTQHRMAVRIEDAGFEIRDMIAWVYGSGFPKSHNLKDEWQGWGTALKPALEPITVARKPLIGTVAANVLAHGTGALNIDGCRVGTELRPIMERTETVVSAKSMAGQSTGATSSGEVTTQGRWPANLIHDGSDEVVGLFPQTAPSKSALRGNVADIRGGNYGNSQGVRHLTNSIRGHNDNGGSAARFFYCAKASKRDRDEGLEGFESKTKKVSVIQTVGVGLHGQSEDGKQISMARNHHPTVKPTDLMRYLCRLVTPPNGVVLDPFMGSGSTGKAAALEGFGFIGIEREAEYVEIAKARIGAAANETHTGDLFA